MSSDLPAMIEDEWYLVRYSGETPEIALHSAMYYLTRAKDGPRIGLTGYQADLLRQAAIDRFGEIILRDLLHANCGTPIYRGICRTIINYRRFCTFCQRQKVDPGEMRRQVAAALDVFLATELAEISRQKRPSIINCTLQDLHIFAAELGTDLTGRLAEIAEFCLPVD
jgi:hypothetical protein